MTLVIKRLIFVFVAALAAGSAACSRERRTSEPSLELSVRVLADTGAVQRLRIDPSPARVWMARVTPARLRADQPPLPEAPPDSLPQAPPSLEIDENLKPPILKSQAVLVLPAGVRAGTSPASVELEVRVDENGEVSQVRWAGGSSDSAIVLAAERCARSMSFYPALRGDRPVAVWCRQRFDFATRRQ